MKKGNKALQEAVNKSSLKNLKKTALTKNLRQMVRRLQQK